MTLDLPEASDAELVREIYRCIKGESEMHYEHPEREIPSAADFFPSSEISR